MLIFIEYLYTNNNFDLVFTSEFIIKCKSLKVLVEVQLMTPNN